MKLKFPLVAAFVAVLNLTACGGGGDSSGGVAVSSPTSLITTDIVVGTGAVAANGKSVTVNYTGWLYSASAADFKGTRFDSGTLPSGSMTALVLGTNQLIAGFEQGMLGMKVGGRRTILVPSSLGYGAAGRPGIPPNSGLVFEVELTRVQ